MLSRFWPASLSLSRIFFASCPVNHSNNRRGEKRRILGGRFCNQSRKLNEWITHIWVQIQIQMYIDSTVCVVDISELHVSDDYSPLVGLSTSVTALGIFASSPGGSLLSVPVVPSFPPRASPAIACGWSIPSPSTPAPGKGKVPCTREGRVQEEPKVQLRNITFSPNTASSDPMSVYRFKLSCYLATECQNCFVSCTLYKLAMAWCICLSSRATDRQALAHTQTHVHCATGARKCVLLYTLYTLLNNVH